MLTVVPTARRRCSVRSVASAAAPKRKVPADMNPPTWRSALFPPFSPQRDAQAQWPSPPSSSSSSTRFRPPGSQLPWSPALAAQERRQPPPRLDPDVEAQWTAPSQPSSSRFVRPGQQRPPGGRGEPASATNRRTDTPGARMPSFLSSLDLNVDRAQPITQRDPPPPRTGAGFGPRQERPVAPHLDPQFAPRAPQRPRQPPPQRSSWSEPRPRTFERPREAVSRPKTAPVEQEEEEDDDDDELPSRSQYREVSVEDEYDEPIDTFRERRQKKGFKKERGSLLGRQVDSDFEEPASQTKLVKPKKAKKVKAPVEKKVDTRVFIPSMVSVGNLARLLNVRLSDLQQRMYMAGMESQSSFDHILTSDYAVLIAEEFGRKPVVNDDAAFDLFPPPPHPDPQSLPGRPPVVTIMGHVDHGKTTLLDTLRSTSVAAGEVGGITQHIGAFSVPVPSALADQSGIQTITFLDTPGHAAFSEMRARGARVTDIIVLVVAADDGVMPQTREVIELIKKDREKVSVVVAINKVDKPGIKVDAIQKALLVEDIHLEELGGDVPAVQVSGLTGHGLPDLLDTLSLLAEIQDVRAEPTGTAFGYVLESRIDQGLGPIATVLVLRGCLEMGSHIICGLHTAKVRLMQDSNGQVLDYAYPGTAVIVSGWKTLPDAGDEVIEGSESDVKRALANRRRKQDTAVAMADVEVINASRQLERERRAIEVAAEKAKEKEVVVVKQEEPSGPKELRLWIKADVSGSAEAVEGALEGIGNHLAVSKVVGTGVGDVTETDVFTAKAIGASIVGFSVNASRNIEILAAQNQVPMFTDAIIYRLMEQVKERVVKLLPVTYETKVLGEATVLELFQITLKGKKLKTIAGSRVVNGLVEKKQLARVVRNGTVVHEGAFETMRHFKKDVTELRKGTECGLNLAGFDDLRVDDLIQAYELIEKPGVL
ncbi:Translation initiation factor IF-2 [Mycena chlorophos]|uniref:Translation initiation factor IF-2, mitochondrial n=1 Tax=Mycena chlorophos TaxID=658473 RepID=A0A8H6WL23_MYCCL|nr:Translation initiation factor IF-2 [Mycena chlorophos]